MRMSPLGVLTSLFDAESREVADIPPSAFCFCCAHGLTPPEDAKRLALTEVLALTGEAGLPHDTVVYTHPSLD